MPVLGALLQDVISLNAEVGDALHDGRAAIALESTLISHGLPFPDNLACAHAAERAVRDEGAVPATIGILDGRIVVGLDHAQMERLADGGDKVRKVSRRDLAFVLASRGDGATTVAATMICAELAGLEVFATGGIGGVHRGVEQTMDISADISELARTRIAVICAGAKIILDLPRTLEALETAGVPVIGIGCEHFPAFFVRDSGIALDQRVASPKEAATIVSAQRSLGFDTGLLFVTPPPAEVAIDLALAEQWLATALARATVAGVSGKAVTPFLLEQVRELSGGQTLTANIALIVNNARVAAQLAVARTTSG